MRKRGRPRLNLRATVVRLSPIVLAKIDATAGQNQRARFIRDAIEEKLTRDTAT